MPGENGASCARLARLALELRAGTALLSRFERWMGFAVDLGCVADESQGLGGRIIGIQGRQRRSGSAARHEAYGRQQCTGNEAAFNERSTRNLALHGSVSGSE